MKWLFSKEHTGLGVANEEMVILYGNTGYTLDRNGVLRRRLLLLTFKLNLWRILRGIVGNLMIHLGRPAMSPRMAAHI